MNKRLELQEHLKGATMYQHPTRGLVWMLKDGSFLSQAEYKKLLRQSWAFWLGGRR